MNLRRSVLAFLGVALSLSVVAAGSLQAQTQQAQQQTNRGSITGIVRDGASNQPLNLVGVQVANTSLGAITGPDGRFTIANVPAGIHQITAKRINYSPASVEQVRVTAGQPITVDIILREQALILTGVVTTGLSDPATGVKAPFSVATVGADKLEVAATNSPLEALAGKVAGLQIRGGTMPGSDVVIQIRNPLSVTGYTQPMIIIDGIIQMQDDPTIGARSINGNPLDLAGENIESVEIVRGAAAAAIYGQRAANGVINITTKRGTDVALGTTRLTLSNEGGFSQVGKQLPQVEHHRYLVDAENQFIDAEGRRIDWTNSTQFDNDPNLFMDNEWGVPIYDNVRSLFHIGQSYRNNLQLNQNNLATNFSVNGSAQHESGVMRVGGGTSRQNLGVNLDYRATRMNAGLTMQYSKYYQANLAVADLAFLNAQTICKCIDITAINPATGEYYPHPDIVNGDYVNPLYFEGNRDEWDRRIGVQTAGNIAYRPTSVLSLTATGGYQRQDREEQEKWVPIGTIYNTGSIAAGEFDVTTNMDETYNGTSRLQILTGMGGWTVRANGSVGGQMQKRNSISIVGDTLTQNQRDFDFIRRTSVSSNTRDVRNINLGGNVAFDYNQKYIVDVLYRQDGSSLLPPDTRWRSNGRASAAWSMNEEPWWPFADLSLFKPRYSIGTAGNNPSFSARYETYLQNSGFDRIFKQNMGNVDIKPEEVTEQEFGLDISFRNRHSVSLTYVRNIVKNAIRPDTILAYTGFDTQQTNLGNLRGDAYEATFESQWIQKRNFRWSSTLVLDRGRQKITSYPRQCPNANTTSTLNRQCEGYVFGQMYGFWHVTDINELSPRHIANGNQDQFDINDEGFLVAVGPGGSWTDMRFGQTVNVDGINYGWGLPILAGVYDEDGDRVGNRVKILGQGLPDFSFGFGNQVTAGKWSVSMQTLGQVGGVIFNQAMVRSINRETHIVLDQGGKPDYLKKTIAYYINGISGSSGSGGLTANAINAFDYFIEGGSFLKISELRVAYRLDAGLPILRNLGMTSGSVALVTRDLYTFSNYSGYDPQVSGSTNVTTARVDAAALPNYRNITASIRLIF
jgi:TonB-linked SusC/RagA family outer membrane protein